MNQITDEQLEALRQDSIHERFIAGSDVRSLIKELRAYKSQVEEMQKVLEEIASMRKDPVAWSDEEYYEHFVRCEELALQTLERSEQK